MRLFICFSTEPRRKRPSLTMTTMKGNTLHRGCHLFVVTMPPWWRMCCRHYSCDVVILAWGSLPQACRCNGRGKGCIGIHYWCLQMCCWYPCSYYDQKQHCDKCLGFFAWRWRDPDKVVVVATCMPSSSLLGYLHSGQDKGAAGAGDAAASATAAANFIIGIIARAMACSSALLKFGGGEVAAIWSMYQRWSQQWQSMLMALVAATVASQLNTLVITIQ